jgi:hypothetical protein
MCGGADRLPGAGGQGNSSAQYTAPDLRQNYAKFRETGTVPYSYYGQGAPTNSDELGRVRAAYPGAFPAGSQQSDSWIQRLLQALRAGGGQGGNGGPFGGQM